MTTDLRVWFIEANNYPLWPTGSERVDHFMNAMGVSHACIIIVEPPIEVMMSLVDVEYILGDESPVPLKEV